MSTNENHISDFMVVVGRIMKLSGKTKEREVAELLGLSTTAFATRKQRNSLPEKEIMITCANNGWSDRWVLTGESETLEQPAGMPVLIRTVDDAMRLLGATSDQELANMIGKGSSDVINWRKSQALPVVIARKFLHILANNIERDIRADFPPGPLTEPDFLEFFARFASAAPHFPKAQKRKKNGLKGETEQTKSSFDIPSSLGRIPIISWAQAGTDGFIEDSHPAGFAEINRPCDVTDPNAYALIVSGESMSPRYEPGDILLVSPSAGVRIGTDAVVRLKGGEVMVKKVKATNSHYLLESFNPDYPPLECQREDVLFVHRVVWVKRGE